MWEEVSSGHDLFLRKKIHVLMSKLLSRRSMNQKLKASGSLMITVADWERVVYLLGVGVGEKRQCTSTVNYFKGDQEPSTPGKFGGDQKVSRDLRHIQYRRGKEKVSCPGEIEEGGVGEKGGFGARGK